MIDYSEKEGVLRFKVRVVSSASRSEIVGEYDGALRARIAAPPVDGAANEELIRTIARRFKVSRSAVQITAGHTSKLKQISVIGGSLDVLEELARVK